MATRFQPAADLLPGNSHVIARQNTGQLLSINCAESRVRAFALRQRCHSGVANAFCRSIRLLAVV